MKLKPTPHSLTSSARRKLALGAALLTFAGAPLIAGTDAKAPETAAPSSQVAAKGAPLPLQDIEGTGGVVITSSAYIVDPQRKGQLVGLPSLGTSYVNLGHGKQLEAVGITESPISRIELGYGFEHFGLGNLPACIRGAGISSYEKSDLELHNFNLRGQIITEGEFGQTWVPAVTVGASYKYNDGIDQVNKELGGLLAKSGISRDSGTDFTLYASKTFTKTPVPIIVDLGGRATEGVWDGLGGFTTSYHFDFEGNVLALVLPNFALGAEFKQQDASYATIGNLVTRESNWYALDAAYVVNKNWTVAVAYGHFGNVLNSQENGVWGITTKWEF